MKLLPTSPFERLYEKMSKPEPMLEEEGEGEEWESEEEAEEDSSSPTKENKRGRRRRKKRTGEWNPAIDQVRDNLATFGQIRGKCFFFPLKRRLLVSLMRLFLFGGSGGRVRSSSFVRRSRHSIMKQNGIHTGALMTMVCINTSYCLSL